MNISSATDPGCKRKNNEDFYYVDKARNLFIIADGMGGHRAGETASRLAVNIAEVFLSAQKITELNDDENKIKNTIIEAIKTANKGVFTEARLNRKFMGMGCTIIVAIGNGNTFHICHVGDVRAYLVSETGISLLTEDHTIIYDLIKMGKITLEEAKNHPLKHMLSRSVGNKENVDVDYNKALLKPGNYLILCSDGLNSMIEDELIKDIVIKENNSDKIKDALINSAKDAGGKDNITVIVINIEEADVIISSKKEKEVKLSEGEIYKTTQLMYPGEKPWWKFW